MQRLLDSKRIEFSLWCDHNKNAKGTEAYESYAANFCTWEKEMLATIREARRNEQATIPIGRDLDAQLNEMLGRATMEEFILAFLHVNDKDKSTLLNVCKALGIDVPTQPPAQQQMMYPPPAALGLPSQLSRPYISHNPGPSHSLPPQHATPLNRVKMTPYGAIPENWTVDPPIIRQASLAPPPKTYAEPTKLPFFDIGSAPR
uniref:Retrotransposon gag domain-containing protein n=1 Tax=Panagrellus redivivus TaxID=6233 RepID=A0A7E4WC30_PANRE